MQSPVRFAWIAIQDICPAPARGSSVRRHPVFLRFVRGVDLDEDVKAAPFLLQAAVEVGEITRKPVGGNGAAVDRVVVRGVGEKDGRHGSSTQAVRSECRQGSVVADGAIDDL